MTSVVEGYETLLEEYYDQMTPLTSSRPYMVAPGNHEVRPRYESALKLTRRIVIMVGGLASLWWWN